MNILITGGAGYIGSHLSDLLIKSGHSVYIYDNFSTGYRQLLPIEVTIIAGDIRDKTLLSSSIRKNNIDAIFHLAAKLIVSESLEKPLEYYDNNVAGTLNVLECCEQCGIDKFIFSSTAAVYGDCSIQTIAESTATLPVNPYGKSKLFSEKMIIDFANSSNNKFKFIILRYFNVAGAAEDGARGPLTKNATHLMKVAAEAALGLRTKVEVFGSNFETVDGTGVRDYIHVEDLVTAHLHALNFLNSGGTSDIFNVGYGAGYSVMQVLNTMKKVSGKAFEVVKCERRSGDLAAVTADSSKIKRILNWQPKYDDIESICRSTFLWEKKNSNYSKE